MAWRQKFIDWLGASVAHPQFMLEIATVDAYLPGAALSHGSHMRGTLAQAVIGRSGSRITAGSLSPIDYSYTTGTATISMKSDADLRRILPRGCLVWIKLGDATWSDADFEPIFLGQYQNIKNNGTNWLMELKSIVGSLQSRFTQSTDGNRLFRLVGETALTANYTAGDATLNVVSTVGLEKLTGENYLVQVYPDSGDPFFLEATGKTATTVTGCSAAGQIGTTAANASSGNTVILCAFLEQNPVDAILTVLTSTGGAYNGPYDTAPETWGMALPYGYVDVDDCLSTRVIVTPTTGSELWDIYAAEPQPDISEWFRGILQPAGMFLCERQGLLTVRGIRPIEGFNHYTTMSILDDDLISIQYDAWDPSHQAEYRLVETKTATGSTFSSPASAISRPVIDVLVYELPYSEENETEWRNTTANRLAERPSRIGELLRVKLKGWKFAQLAPGDEIVLYTRFFSAWDYPLAQNGVVLSVQPDWFGSTTDLVVIWHPDRTEFK